MTFAGSGTEKYITPMTSTRRPSSAAISSGSTPDSASNSKPARRSKPTGAAPLRGAGRGGALSGAPGGMKPRLAITRPLRPEEAGGASGAGASDMREV